jgi:PAS domain-containing protein
MKIWDIDPDSRERKDKENMWNAIKSGNKIIFNARQKRKNNEMIDVEVTLGPLFYSGKKMLIGIVRDITEKKKIQEDMLLQKKFYETIIENMPNMVFVKDVRELRFELFNRAGEKLLACKRDDII